MKNQRTKRLVSILVTATAVALSLPRSLEAQGFGIYEQGGCMDARAGAGVAHPCDDGSAIYFNPAGLAGQPGLWLTGGLTGIAPVGSFRSDAGMTTDLERALIPVPHAYFRYGFHGRLAVGFGEYVPYGLAIKWPLNFEGRFVSYESSLRSVYLQPTVAYRLSQRVSVGGGPVIAIGSVGLNRQLDLSQQLVPPGLGLPAGLPFRQLGVPSGTPFSDLKLDASGAVGVGGNFGILAQVTDRVGVGLRYLTRVGLDYTGTARFQAVPTGVRLPPGNPFGLPPGTPLDNLIGATGLFAPGGPLTDQEVRTSIDMPDQLVAGVSVEASDRLTILVDYQWTHWSLFQTVPIDFSNPSTPDQTLIENFRNTSGVRIGADVMASKNLRVRLGYIFNQAAEPPEAVTPLLPEARRNHVTAGIGYRFGSRVELDFMYQYLGQAERRGRVVNPPPGQPPTIELNSGDYLFHAHLFGTSLTLRY